MVPVSWMRSRSIGAGEGCFEPVAALFEADVLFLVDHAEDEAVDACGVEGFGGRLAGDAVVERDVDDRAEAGGDGGAGVEREHDHAGSLRFGERGRQRRRVGQRGDDRGDAEGGALADEGRLDLTVGVGDHRQFEAEFGGLGFCGVVEGAPVDIAGGAVGDEAGSVTGGDTGDFERDGGAVVPAVPRGIGAQEAAGRQDALAPLAVVEALLERDLNAAVAARLDGDANVGRTAGDGVGDAQAEGAEQSEQHGGEGENDAGILLHLGLQRGSLFGDRGGL